MIHLTEKFLQSCAHFLQCLTALGCDVVKPPPRPAYFIASLDPAVFLHRAEHGIKRASTDLVTVMSQFLNHPVTKQITLLRMVQHVHPDEAGENALEGFINRSHYRISIASLACSCRQCDRQADL